MSLKRVLTFIFLDEGCMLTEDKTNWVKNDNDSLDIWQDVDGAWQMRHCWVLETQNFLPLLGSIDDVLIKMVSDSQENNDLILITT